MSDRFSRPPSHPLLTATCDDQHERIEAPRNEDANETARFHDDGQTISPDVGMRRTGDVVVMRVTFAGPAGWSAEATHPAMPSWPEIPIWI